jgi:hypothetical protein
MSRNMPKVVIIVFFMFFGILSGVIKSFAQDDVSSDEQMREDQTKQTLNQIHDLETKMQDNAKRLDALEKEVNQPDTEQENSIEAAPAEQVSEVQAPIEQAEPVHARPVLVVSTQSYPQETSFPPMKHEPVYQAPIYYPPSTDFPKEHTFELGQEDFYSSYKEPGEHRTGAFYGVNSAYSYRPWDAQYWPINVYHIDVHGDYGRVDYDFGDGGKTKNVNNYMVEPRAWVGKDFIFDSTRLTPYVGFGYRWYFEELKNKMTDSEEINGLNFQLQSNNTQTQYLYIPLGAQLSVRPIGGWRIDMNGEYDFLVWGRVTNYAPNFSVNSFNINSPAVNNTLRNGFGIRGSIKFTKEEDACNYFVEPYVRYWNVRASNTVSDPFSVNGVPLTNVPVQQAKSNTTEVGARAGIEF